MILRLHSKKAFFLQLHLLNRGEVLKYKLFLKVLKNLVDIKQWLIIAIQYSVEKQISQINLCFMYRILFEKTGLMFNLHFDNSIKYLSLQPDCYRYLNYFKWLFNNLEQFMKPKIVNQVSYLAHQNLYLPCFYFRNFVIKNFGYSFLILIITYNFN
jgi:hypothetical protein